MLLWASEKLLRTEMSSEELLGMLCNRARRVGQDDRMVCNHPRPLG